ncbi:MAG: hypothetical protein ACREQJ_00890, partial [Candidatus Binatia bacterium]
MSGSDELAIAATPAGFTPRAERPGRACLAGTHTAGRPRTLVDDLDRSVLDELLDSRVFGVAGGDLPSLPRSDMELPAARQRHADGFPRLVRNRLHRGLLRALSGRPLKPVLTILLRLCLTRLLGIGRAFLFLILLF